MPSDVLLAEIERILTSGRGWPVVASGHEQAVRLAATHNWFIQPESPVDLMFDIEECKDDVEKLNGVMSASTEEFLDEIRIRMLCDYPNRVDILEEVFALHSEGRYLASIPLTLATAEGIGFDETKKSIFNVWRKRPEIAVWIDDSGVSRHNKAVLAALIEAHPMAKSKAGYLSRHDVLHGRLLNYGKKAFSLQAISLLGFVGWAFSNDGLT